MSRPRVFLGALLVAGLLSCHSTNAAGPAKKAPPAGADILLLALEEELARSVGGLRIEGQEKPYFVEYAVADLWTVEATASLGALVTATANRRRPLQVTVRVGSHELDNTGFASMAPFAGAGGPPRELVVEDDGLALRRGLWLATDAAYKGALEQLAQKKAALKSRVEPEPVPDFTRETPSRSLEPPATLDVDAARAGDLVRRLSALCRDFPLLQQSVVHLQAVAGAKLLVNSEGTVLRRKVSHVWLTARASAQAADGMLVRHLATFAAPAVGQLPPEAELAAGVRKMATELTGLVTAPAAGKYVGPVLVTGQAAPELLAQVLEPHLSAVRPPVAATNQPSGLVPRGELADRLGRPVLPPFLSVVDDPTLTSVSGAPLLGSFAFDDQGVAARRVTLVEKGVLKTLLAGRRPTKEVSASNGHARTMGGMGGMGGAVPRIGNLVVEALPAKSAAELELELRELCRAQGLSHGLVLETLDVPTLGMRDASSFLLAGGVRATAPLPLVVYRLSVEDGSRELLRGVSLGGLSVRSLKDIVAAGGEPVVSSRLLGAQSVLAFDQGGPGGTPASVVAPSILVSELEVSPPTSAQQKPVVVPRPALRKAEPRPAKK